METKKTYTQAEVDALLAEKDARIAELEKKKLAILAEIDEVTAAIKSRDDEAEVLKQRGWNVKKGGLNSNCSH